MNPMRRARTSLVYARPWWGSLALRLRLKECSDVLTASTNGKTVLWNPEWFGSLPQRQREAVLAHEVSHCALGHIWRIGDRDVRLANLAADHVVNLDLQEAGFSLPDGAQADPRFAGMSFEEVYDILAQETAGQSCGRNGDSVSGECDGQQTGGGGKRTGGDPRRGGGFDGNVGAMDNSAHGSGNDAEAGEAESLRHEWEVSARVATSVATGGMGEIPASLRREMDRAVRPKVTLETVLQRYLSSYGGTSYSRPAKRWVHRGLILPGPVRTRPTEVVLAVDTSGSIGAKELGMFQRLTSAVSLCPAAPEMLHVVYCDAEVQRVDRWAAGDVPEFRPDGGGGTMFQPVLDEIERRSLQPDVLIWLTDMMACDLGSLAEPVWPVVWARTGNASWPKIPFGDQVFMGG